MKKILYSLIVMVLIFSLCACGNKYESLLEEAENAYLNGNRKEAVDLYKEAIDLWPEMPEAYKQRAEMFSGEEQYDKAIKDYNKAISLGDKSVYASLGKVYAVIGEDEQAIEAFKSYIEYDDQDVNAYLDLIKIYNDNGMYKEARDLKTAGYEATGKKKLRINVFNEEEAKGIGGVYVRSGENFYLLQPVGDEGGYNTVEGYKYTDPENEDIPVICEGEELVFFSENALEESYPIYKIDRTGYTFPLHFSDPGFYDSKSLYGNDITLPQFDNSEMKFAYDNEIGNNFRISTVESINGMEYRDYYNANVPLEEIAEVNKGDTVTFSYHDGSEYMESSSSADLKFYHYQCENEISLQGSLTQGSYGIIDTSGLSSGTYMIPFEMNKKYIIYFSNKLNFLFRVDQ